MPLAVTHVVITFVLLSLYRARLMRRRAKIPFSFLFLVGVGALLPDIDVPVYWLVHDLLGYETAFFNKMLTHSIFFPLFFMLIALLLYFLPSLRAARRHLSHLRNHLRKWGAAFELIGIGALIHVLLDTLLIGLTMPLYPLSDYVYTSGLLSWVRMEFFWRGLDAVVLLGCLYYIGEKYIGEKYVGGKYRL